MSSSAGAEGGVKTRSNHVGEMLTLLDHTTPVGSGFGWWKRESKEHDEAGHGFDETSRARAIGR